MPYDKNQDWSPESTMPEAPAGTCSSSKRRRRITGAWEASLTSFHGPCGIPCVGSVDGHRLNLLLQFRWMDRFLIAKGGEMGTGKSSFLTRTTGHNGWLVGKLGSESNTSIRRAERGLPVLITPDLFFITR